MGIDILNITEKKSKYNDLIENFLDSLDEEKQYFELDRERFAKFELIIIAIDNERIVGLCGLERKMGFVRTLMTIHKGHQSRGLAQKMVVKLISEARKTHNIILGVTEEKNYKAENLQYLFGYKKVGKKGHLVYSFKPLNIKGLIIYYFIRAVFPLIKIIDRFR